MSTEALLERTEFANPNEQLDAFVLEKLQKHDTIDKDGIVRPAFVINGREVVFRTRQEAPLYDDVDVMVPGGAHVYPVERQAYDPQIGESRQTDESTVRSYIDSHSAEADRMVVTNSSEGMLVAAALLVESNEDSQRMMELADTFAEGKTWTEAQKDAVDTMLAAISVNDQNEISQYLNMDGWALALAALSGDQEAKAMVTKKREVLIEAERERASDPGAVEEMASRLTERGIELSEPIPLDQLALVHSTSYDIQRDETGAIVLRSAGQQRSDKLPRASLHFTLNSKVGDVTGNLETQTWSDTNKIIVANFKKVVDANHKLPNVMAGMDTWFTLNPGEATRLPDALVVEQVDQTPSGRVIEITDTGVQYLLKESYTAEDRELIRQLSRKYQANDVADIALRAAMSRQGVPVELMDYSSSDGHSMYSHEIDGRVNATAAALGVPSGKHFDTPEANMERDVYTSATIYNNPKDGNGEWYFNRAHASIEARRQTLASGFFPAVPLPEDEEASGWGV